MIDKDKDTLLHLIHKWVFSGDNDLISYRKEMLGGSVTVMDTLLNLKDSDPDSFNLMREQFELEQNAERSR